MEVLAGALSAGALSKLGLLGRSEGEVLGDAVGALTAERGEYAFSRRHGHLTATSCSVVADLRVQRKGPLTFVVPARKVRRQPAGHLQVPGFQLLPEVHLPPAGAPDGPTCR
jgi:hypothetical protein